MIARSNDLIVIPAIDLKGGRCVRLKQGRMSDETVFSDVPEEMAVKWYEKGAERLHIVDLDGAVQGKPVNGHAIKRIVDSLSRIKFKVFVSIEVSRKIASSRFQLSQLLFSLQ